MPTGGGTLGAARLTAVGDTLRGVPDRGGRFAEGGGLILRQPTCTIYNLRVPRKRAHRAGGEAVSSY